MKLRVKRIRRGNKTRIVYVAPPEVMACLRDLLPALMAAERKCAAHFNVSEVAHGFIAGRSPVTNAMAHVGPWRYTLTLDIADWFDSVTNEEIRRTMNDSNIDFSLKEQTRNACFLGRASPNPKNYCPRQGLPTSPVLANIAGAAFDAHVMAWFRSNRNVVYTRYADDLAFSVMTPGDLEAAVQQVHIVARAFGWRINPTKTCCYRANAGRRIVCGISVGRTNIQVPRDMRRKLRAARHQPTGAHLLGLEEWCCLKPPRVTRARRLISGGNPCVAGEIPARSVAVQQEAVSSSARRLIL